ncbi:aminotransferase [Coemansia sp. RSA 2618]|nr:aminotransferase [Coemansia sp. RSA 2618]
MQLVLTKDGQCRRSEINATSTMFGQFKEYLAQLTLLPKDDIVVKLGDPLTVLDYPDHTLLADTPVNSDLEVTVALRPKQSNAPEQPGTVHCAYGASECVAVGDGYLVRRRVPGDDSCLFSSLVRCLGRAGLTPHRLRALVAKTIEQTPEIYNEGVLGKSVDDYCAWILDPKSWGGGIEMRAASQAFRVEICSIDTRTQRVDRFGEDELYAHRVFLIYTGSHYDYIAFATQPDNPQEFDQTGFLTGLADSDTVLAAAIELAAKA